MKEFFPTFFPLKKNLIIYTYYLQVYIWEVVSSLYLQKPLFTFQLDVVLYGFWFLPSILFSCIDSLRFLWTMLWRDLSCKVLGVWCVYLMERTHLESINKCNFMTQKFAGFFSYLKIGCCIYLLRYLQIF